MKLFCVKRYCFINIRQVAPVLHKHTSLCQKFVETRNHVHVAVTFYIVNSDYPDVREICLRGTL